MLSAMRGVLKACFRLGYISADDLRRAADVPPARGSRLPPGRAVDRGELYALFRLCYKDIKKARGARDAALFALLYACGLRRSEAPRPHLATTLTSGQMQTQPQLPQSLRRRIIPRKSRLRSKTQKHRISYKMARTSCLRKSCKNISRKCFSITCMGRATLCSTNPASCEDLRKGQFRRS